MSHLLPKNPTVRESVLGTLAYFDLFGIPLTESDIADHLLFQMPDREKIAIYLRESPLVTKKDGYLSLSKDPEFFAEFARKKARAAKYWKRIRHFQWLFNMCPFVKLIAVCNSLPIEDIHENSDIDLLIITERDRLFTARLFLTFFSSLLGLRRHGLKIKKRFCLSFYLTEDNLNLEEIAQKPYDIYLAYWLKTLEPICGDYATYERLIKENMGWLKDYFPAVIPMRRHFRKRHSHIKLLLEKLFGSSRFEYKQKNYQLARSKEKYTALKDKTGTIISEKMLKFHDNDVRALVRKNWAERVNRLLS